MTSAKSQLIATALLRRVAEHGNGTHVADVVADTWREIEEALAPVMGKRGVAALYTRSLHQTAKRHPWLMSTFEPSVLLLDAEELGGTLRQQEAEQAAVGGAELLQNLHELLASLVGPALTERLLRSAWATLLSGSTAQDSSP